MSGPFIRRAVVAILGMCIAISSLAAQSGNESYAFIIYAEGFDMTVFRNDELLTYDVLVDDVIGMPLLPGDLVQTDADTFVEIQVMPSRTVVKVAENTTFRIERIGGAGGGTFNMAYGRLRARVERLTTEDTFEIRGSTAVAGVRGTDFGYDQVIERDADNALQTRVYVFEGEVAVTENAPPGAGTEPSDTIERDGAPETDSAQPTAEPAAPQTVTLRANEMVNVVSEAPPELRERESGDGVVAPESISPTPTQVVFQQESLREDIEEFWVTRDFQEEAIDPSRVEERFPGINARVQQLTLEQRQYEELQRLRREGLLGDPGSQLAEAVDELEPTAEERDPVQVALGAPADRDRIERLILPQDGRGPAQQLRIAGHWLVGVGAALEIAGLAGAWFIEGYRTPEDLRGGGPAVGAMLGGGVFITSGLMTYLFSLFAE